MYYERPQGHKVEGLDELHDLADRAESVLRSTDPVHQESALSTLYQEAVQIGLGDEFLSYLEALRDFNS